MRNFAICLMLLVVIGTASVRAQDATWAGGTADDPQWHATANWTPAIVPTGTATFGSSGARFPITFTDSGGIGIDTSIDTMHFLANAPSYIFQIGSTFTPQELKITGLGVVNDAAARPMFFVTGGGGPAGMLTFAGSSTAANSSISIVNQASVIFSNSSSAGSSEIRPDFRTKLVFRDSSSAQNSTISGDGFIYFLNNSTAGKALINASSFNKLSFLDNSTAGNSTIYGNVTFGMHSTGSSARYIGVEDIVCSSTLSVGVTSPGMTIGSIEGVGRVLLGNKRLSVGTNNLSTTYAGTISGDANSSLQKVGASTLSLTGVNTYTGATLVDSGQLNIDGSISSSALTTINAGGILSGNGMVGDTVVSGGRLAPGNAVATLNVNGSLTFSAASSYLIEVSPTQASQVNVSGTATLGGAIVRATFDPSSYVAKHYTIVTATGGVNGTFGNYIASNLPQNFQSGLSYDATHVFLNLALKFGPDYNGGLNDNQRAVANALTNFFNTTGSIPASFGSLTPAGLTMSAGELSTGSQQTTFDAMNLFMGLLADPFAAGRNDAELSQSALSLTDERPTLNAYVRSQKERDAYAAIYRKAPPVRVYDPRWNIWAAGFGGSQTTDGNTSIGSSATTSRIYGSAVGADYWFSPDTVAGFAIAGGETNFSVANALGTGRSHMFQAGGFVRHSVGAAYVAAALAYGWQNITTSRVFTATGDDPLRAEFSANAYSGRIESGYRFTIPLLDGLALAPYAAAQSTTFALPGYKEQAKSGVGMFALNYAPKSITDPRSELGLRSDKSFALQDGLLTFRTRVAWAHNYDPDRSTSATFQALPTTSFVVNGAAQAKDSALTSASVEVRWLSGWSAGITFEGEFSSVTDSYAGKGVVRHVW